MSPSSETFSHTHPDPLNPPRNATPQAQPQNALSGSNGHAANIPPASSTPPPRRPKNAFDFYCNEMRPTLMAQKKDESASGAHEVERALAGGWQGLSQSEKLAFQDRFIQSKKRLKLEKEAGARAAALEGTPTPVPETTRQAEDEDVEMTEGGQSPIDTAGDAEGSFTAANNS